MDADSSYGGSDTAQDSTCGNENSSLENTTITSHNDTSQNNTSNESNDLVSTICVNTEENPYYNKNEITLPVNRDETDFKNENITKVPNYLTTANLNINETLEHHSNLEAMSKQYKSTSYLNAESESPPNHRKSGLDNPCFDDADEPKDKHSIKSSFDQSKPYNGDLNLSVNSSINNDEPLTEAVNLELINLKPSGKDVTGLYENGKNGMTSIPMKQDVDAEMGNPYDEYFVPVNEHKKYMRGEKLYVTMDKRNVKKKSKCLCWGVCISIVLAAVIVGILAAVGIIGTKPVQEVSSRQFSGSAPEVKSGGIFGLPPNLDAEDTPENYVPKYTPGPSSSTAPYPLTTDMSEIVVPRALESQIKIDNLEFDPEYANKNSQKFKDLASTIESELKQTIFSDEELKHGPAEIEVKIVDFTEGSVRARYRIVWKFKDGSEVSKDPIDANLLEERMATKMKENRNQLSAFQINEEASMNKTMGVLDFCKIQNNGCEYKCSFDYIYADFICLCPEGKSLNEDGKHCDPYNRLPVHKIEDEFIEPIESIVEPTPEPESHSDSVSIPKDHPETTQNPQPELLPIPTTEPEPHISLNEQGEPTQEPQSEPSPQPEFIPEYTAEHHAVHTSEPHAEPTSEPHAEPTSEPHAEPTSEPHAEPTSEPQAVPTAKPVSDPHFQTTKQPLPEPTSEPQSEPLPEPQVESTSEPHAEPTAEPHAEPTSKPQAVPHAEPTSEPQAEPTSEPQAEPTSEPQAEPTSEPQGEPISESHSKPTSKPQAEPTSEPQAQLITEVHAEPSTEPNEKPISKLFAEYTSEPQAEQTSEPLVEQTPVPQAEPTPEPNAEPTLEPNVYSSSESIPKSNTEPLLQPVTSSTDESLKTTTAPKSETGEEIITFKPPSEPETVTTNMEQSSESSTEIKQPMEDEDKLNTSVQTEAINTMLSESFGNSSTIDVAQNTSLKELQIKIESNTESETNSKNVMSIESDPLFEQNPTTEPLPLKKLTGENLPTETSETSFEHADSSQNHSSPLPDISNESNTEFEPSSEPESITQFLPAFNTEMPIAESGRSMSDLLTTELNVSTEQHNQQSSNEITTLPTIPSGTEKLDEEIKNITQITTVPPPTTISSYSMGLDNIIGTENHEKIVPSEINTSSSTSHDDLITINPQLFGQNLTEEISTESVKNNIYVFNNSMEGVKSEKIIDQSNTITEKMPELTDQITTSRHVEELTESTNNKVVETHQDILLNEHNEYSNNLEIMSPFLPDIENDTFINSLRSDDHFVDHIMHSNVESSEEYTLTTKSPRLDNDQLNKTNPLDPNPTDAISIDEENFIKDHVTTQSSQPSRDSADNDNNFRRGKENDNLTENVTFFMAPNETENTTREEPSNSTEPIAPEILNNVHSNSFFDKMDQLMEPTQKPSKLDETTFEMTTVRDTAPEMTNSVSHDKSGEVTETIDEFTISSAEIKEADQDSITSASNNNDTNDISGSTEDLIAMETTTFGIKANDFGKKKSKFIKNLKEESEVIKNTESNTKSAHDEESELNNEFDKNIQTYAVQETIIDSTTTTKLFVTKPTTSTPLNSKSPEGVNGEPNSYSGTTNSLNDIFNEDITNKSSKLQETPSNEVEITTEVLTGNTRQGVFGDHDERPNRLEYFGKKLRMDEPLLTTLNEIVTKSANDVKPVTEGFYIMGFTRCESDQFQCVNGTSVTNGSYCISIGDRCDSVPDCSDGSDEIDCQKEGCPNNFQCASGQCLKRHLVCDGIVNCNDNSDEVNCESWNCTSNEFSCGKNDRCIPTNWKCDGRSHCRDGSDENDCSGNECPENHFRCSERGGCLPNTWKCDGKSDCSNGMDESDCGCSDREFKCKMGGGCIKLKQVCDGVSDCGDKSDEWKCLTTRQPASLLEAHSKNETSLICSINWNTTFSDIACENMGYDSSAQYEEVEKPAEATKLLRIKDGAVHDSSILMSLQEVSSCEKVVTVKCQRNACGINSDAVPITRENYDNQTYNLPSLTLLYNNKQNTYCSGSLIAQSWIISAYSCVLGSLNGLDMALNDWVVKVGGQQRMVVDFIEHPKVKYSNFYYNNDVVLIKLDRPVTSTTNVSAVCIAKDTLNDTHKCVIAGWRNLIPGDAAKKQYLNHLTMPLISIQECNSSRHYNGMMNEGEICVESKEPDKFACYDDVGAPLICLSEKTKMWELYGILSHPNKCEAARHPLVYTSINRDLTTWIENTIGQAASAKSV